MTESPAERTPYEVFGVAASASEEELRRAYRRRARETHPDTGGSAEAFLEVQVAWERVGTAGARAIYDRGGVSRGAPGPARPGSAGASAGGGPGEPPAAWFGSPTRAPRQDSRPRARTHGHPGGRARELYLAQLREWMGRGAAIPDPYDPALVRSAPAAVRRHLAKALAEEAEARAIGELGMGFTLWSDVIAGEGGKLDHVVLGPAGLFAVASEDWGSPVELKRGELIGAGISPGEQPIRTLTRAARAFAKQSRVRFTGLIIVVPDSALEQPVLPLGRGRHASTMIVQRSLLPIILRNGVPGLDRGSLADVFELRSVLQQSIRFR